MYADGFRSLFFNVTDLIDFDPRIEFDAAILAAQNDGDLDPSLDHHIVGETLRRMILVEASPLTNPAFATLDTVEVFLRGAGAPPPPSAP